MEETFITASIWVGLALVATFAASRLRVSLALMEILVGVAAAAIASHWLGAEATGSKAPWLVFVASAGATLLTFLAGAELEPSVMRAKWKARVTPAAGPESSIFTQGRSASCGDMTTPL